MKTAMMTAALIAGASGLANGQTVTELRSDNGSIARDINDAGVIVGEQLLADGTTLRATMWSGAAGAANDIGVAFGAESSTAYAINASGQVVGYSEFGDGLRTATLWNGARGTDASILNLGAAMGSTGSSVAWDINDHGVVVGQAPLSPGFSKGFVWDGTNGGQTAGAPSFYMGSANRGINNSGSIVGSAFFFGDPDDAYLAIPDGRGGYSHGDIAPPGYNLSIATDIADNGTIVGFTSFGLDDSWQAAKFLGRGEIELLGTLDGLENSEANAVNESGLVVGRAWDNDFMEDNAAVAWLDGVVYDLNDFRGISGFERLYEATGVNNNGDIVGFGRMTDGTLSGFVITGFVPAPGAVGVLAMGLGLVSRRRR